MLEARIRAVFAQLAETEPPPPEVSIAGAIRRGRRLLRWRRARTAGTPVLAASAVVAVALTGALPAGSGGQAPKHTAGRSAPRAAAPRRFNPLLTYASFNWLPAGQAIGSGADNQLSQGLDVYSGKHFRWQLSAYADRVCRLGTRQTMLTCALGDGATQYYQLGGPAASINGHAAFWLSGGLSQKAGSRTLARNQHQAVVWQYAPGGWAELGKASASRQAPSTVLKIARAATFGNRQPVAFAARMTMVPASWRVNATNFSVIGGKPLATEYVLSADGADADRNLPTLTVTPRGSGCYFYPGQSRHRVIRSTRAVVTTIPAADGRPPSYQLCAADAGGLSVFIVVNAAHPAQTPTTVFRDLTLLGPSPARWSTQPIG